MQPTGTKSEFEKVSKAKEGVAEDGELFNF